LPFETVVSTFISYRQGKPGILETQYQRRYHLLQGLL